MLDLWYHNGGSSSNYVERKTMRHHPVAYMDHKSDVATLILRFCSGVSWAIVGSMIVYAFDVQSDNLGHD